MIKTVLLKLRRELQEDQSPSSPLGLIRQVRGVCVYECVVRCEGKAVVTLHQNDIDFIGRREGRGRSVVAQAEKHAQVGEGRGRGGAEEGREEWDGRGERGGEGGEREERGGEREGRGRGGEREGREGDREEKWRGGEGEGKGRLEAVEEGRDEEVEGNGRERVEEGREERFDGKGMRGGLIILQCMMHCLCMFVW